MDDRISELSDDILSYILTMLSVKDLLKTSILSRRRCKLWAVRRDLFFDIFMLGTTEDDLLQFGYLVDASDTENRQVNLDKSAGVFVERVVQFIKNKNLRSLSPVSAKLDENFLESLLSNCPRLQELFLIFCELKSLPVIVSSSLCHLKVLWCYLVFNDLEVDANLFLVDCLRLISLESFGCELDTSSIKTPMLKSGKFSILPKHDLKAFVALCATFPQLEILHVEIFPTVKTSIQITQPFKRLKQLNLVLFADSFIYDMGYGLL